MLNAGQFHADGVFARDSRLETDCNKADADRTGVKVFGEVELSHGNTVNILLKSFSFAASRSKGCTPKISSMVRSMEPCV
jgi:hypothetical protein